MWRIIVEISSVAEVCVTCAEIDMSDPIGWTVRMAGGGDTERFDTLKHALRR